MYRIIKYAIYLALFILMINSLVLLFISIFKSVEAYILISQLRFEERPAVFIAESVDAFLISLVFLIFAIGILKLFLPDSRFIKNYDLPWLKVENFSQLKLILWEMLLTTLLMFFVSRLVTNIENLDWTILIIPLSIIMLSLSLKFLKSGH